MKKYLSRRDFLKAIAVISGAAGVGLAKILSNPAMKGLSQQLTDYRTFLPLTVSVEEDGAALSRVRAAQNPALVLIFNANPSDPIRGEPDPGNSLIPQEC